MTNLLLIATLGVVQATQQAAPPRQRTEAEACAIADRNRAQRAEQAKQAGAPVELIPSYAKAAISAVPESLGVDPFHKKDVDALGSRHIAEPNLVNEAVGELLAAATSRR